MRTQSPAKLFLEVKDSPKAESGYSDLDSCYDHVFWDKTDDFAGYYSLANAVHVSVAAL
jgi:hypothetical protein